MYPEVQFLENILKQIVDNTEELFVDRTVDDLGVLLKVRVAEEDMGKVIGKQGKTTEALKILLKAIGAKHNTRINLKIVDRKKEDPIVSLIGDTI